LKGIGIGGVLIGLGRCEEDEEWKGRGNGEEF
jgi:hypothetical protein